MAGCGGLEHQAATPASQETRVRAGAASVVNNVTVDLQPGWNGVGLQSQRVNALSTNSAISGFAFYENGSYQIRSFTAEALNAGAGGRRGLFVRTETPTSFTYSGTDEAQGNFVDLVSGWNLVSFTTSTDLPGSSLSGPLGTLVLPTFYQINADNSLAEVNVQSGGLLRAGRAYWVFANGAARLTLPAPPAASPSPSPPGLGPAVSQLSPNSGWIGGTSGVLITGTGFQRVIDVRFGGTSVFFTHVSPTQLLCEAPPQAQLNPPSPSVHVRVITADGTSAAGDGALWTYNTAARPPGNPPAAGGLAPVVVAAGAHTFNTDTGFLDGALATGWDGVNGRWNASSFQLAAGGTLTVSGARAFQVNATSAVQIDGTIAAPGGPGGSGASGVPGTGGARGPGGAAGGAGASNGPGGNGSEVGAPAGGRGRGSNLGLGGGSGAGHLNAGTAAALAGGTAYTSIPTALVGGSGGGGGGGSGVQTGGGGGGGGGGAVRLESTAAVTISATGVINCSGGNGGDAFAAAPATGSGGGGGGSGGSIHLIGTPVTQNGTLNVAGGSGGAGALAGAAGGGGSVGRTVP